MQDSEIPPANAAAAAASSRSRPPVAFHDKYLDLCRQRNAQPLRTVYKGRLHNALEFCADRVRLDEWNDVLRALPQDQCLGRVSIRLRKRAPKVLDRCDSEKKCRTLRTEPLIATRYVFGRTITALCQMLAHNKAIVELQLEGLPMRADFAATLADGLRQNGTLRRLSLARSALGDEGCGSVCGALRTMPTVDRVDLSDCGLGAAGAKSVAQLMGYQKIQRFTEAWQESLRYRDVDPDQIAGLKYLRVDDNPDIGDVGLQSIIDVLAEDVWIKSVQAQNCGLSDAGARALIACLDANKTLMVFDVRNNEAIGEPLMNRIRQQFAVETAAEAADDADQQRRLLDRAEEGRLNDRIVYLEQQLQIESLVRRQAEQLSGQLQNQLECGRQQRAKMEATSEVPDGYVMVPTKQLSSLFLEVEEIRGTSTSSHSTSLLTQISNPKFVGSQPSSDQGRHQALRKAKSETTHRDKVVAVLGNRVQFKATKSECEFRQTEPTRRPSTPRFVEKNMGDCAENTNAFQRMLRQTTETEEMHKPDKAICMRSSIDPSSFFEETNELGNIDSMDEDAED